MLVYWKARLSCPALNQLVVTMMAALNTDHVVRTTGFPFQELKELVLFVYRYPVT